MSDLIEINKLAGALLASVSSGAKRQLLGRMARAIRKSQSDRIGRQLQPDGTRFAPRKAASGRKRRKGQLREKMMFRRLRLAKFLKAGATPGEAWVGFAGRAASIASVHQHGLADSPTRGAKKVRYTQRVLLGLTDGEQDRAVDLLLEHIVPH
nr:phage virion morphogenesis protein [uncultured Sphingomonas sp.]